MKLKPEQGKLYYNPKEVAEMLGLSSVTIRLRARSLRCKKKGYQFYLTMKDIDKIRKYQTPRFFAIAKELGVSAASLRDFVTLSKG